ncbi:MAG: hypothetical protein JXR60_04475 [Bacteroidales bacterium]|nr:hypothetical protein [Bacteroidales bacterium]
MKHFYFMLLSLLSLFSLNSLAQDPKWTNYYKIPERIEEKDYSISFQDIVSRMTFVKMAIEIQNNSNDYLIYKTEETSYSFDFGKYSAESKIVYINPHQSKKKTIKAEGSNQFINEKFTLLIDGLYRVPSEGKVIRIEQFQLPASQNEIQVGDFIIKLLKLKKTTAETVAKFECTYTGDKVAIVNASKLSVTIDGKENIVYANDDKKVKDQLLLKGESLSFNAIFHIPGKIADMQFATMQIIWNDTFIVSEAIKVEPVQQNFVLDPGLTQGKNK